MFDNIGGKIKGVAQVFCWIGIIASLLTGFVLMIAGFDTRVGEMMVIIGLAVMIVGSLLSWVGSLITYGIGEMVQNSCVQTELAVKQAMKEEQAE